MKGEITYLALPGCRPAGRCAAGRCWARSLCRAGHKARSRLAQQARRPRSPGRLLSRSWGPAPTPDQMARISGRVSIPWTLMSFTPGGAPEPTGRTGGPATGEEKPRPQGAPRSGSRRGRASPGHHPELGGSPGRGGREERLRPQGAPRSSPRRGRVSPGHHPELGGSPGGDCRPSLLRTQVKMPPTASRGQLPGFLECQPGIHKLVGLRKGGHTAGPRRVASSVSVRLMRQGERSG